MTTTQLYHNLSYVGFTPTNNDESSLIFKTKKINEQRVVSPIIPRLLAVTICVPSYYLYDVYNILNLANFGVTFYEYIYDHHFHFIHLKIEDNFLYKRLYRDKYSFNPQVIVALS